MSEFLTEENNNLESTKNDKHTHLWKKTTYDLGTWTKEPIMRYDKIKCSRRLQTTDYRLKKTQQPSKH